MNRQPYITKTYTWSEEKASVIRKRIQKWLAHAWTRGYRLVSQTQSTENILPCSIYLTYTLEYHPDKDTLK